LILYLAYNDKRAPFCVLCQQTLTNESWKADRLETHLRAKALVRQPKTAGFRPKSRCNIFVGRLSKC